MLYTEDTRIEALAVHVVGNKSKDEPLTVSPQLSAQVADEGLMRTLTAYFLRSEERRVGKECRSRRSPYH